MEAIKRWFSLLSDSRNILLIFFVVLALGITWSTINQIELNYSLEQESRQLQAEVAILEQQNANQRLQNEFFATDYFKELAIRDQLGLVEPGENVLVLRSDDIEAITSLIASQSNEEAAASEQRNPSNFELWVDFFKGDLN